MTASSISTLDETFWNVVIVFQRIEEVEHCLGAVGIQIDVVLGFPGKLGGDSAVPNRFQTIPDVIEIVRVAGDFVSIFRRLYVLRAGFQRDLEHVVGIARICGIIHLTDPVEHEIDAAGFTKISTEFGERRARTSLAVRLRLSVSASTMTATPLGPYPSYRFPRTARCRRCRRRAQWRVPWCPCPCSRF